MFNNLTFLKFVYLKEFINLVSKTAISIFKQNPNTL